MQTSERETATDIPTPFEWRRHRAQAEAAPRPPARPRRAKSAGTTRQSAAEKAAQVLAHRWCGAYCRPGWP